MCPWILHNLRVLSNCINEQKCKFCSKCAWLHELCSPGEIHMKITMYTRNVELLYTTYCWFLKTEGSTDSTVTEISCVITAWSEWQIITWLKCLFPSWRTTPCLCLLWRSKCIKGGFVGVYKDLQMIFFFFLNITSLLTTGHWGLNLCSSLCVVLDE